MADTEKRNDKQSQEPSPPSTDLAKVAAEKCYDKIEHDCLHIRAMPPPPALEAIISEVYAPLDTQIANYERDLMHKSIELASARQEREQLIGDLRAAVQDYTEQSKAVRELLEARERLKKGTGSYEECKAVDLAAERLRKLREGIPQLSEWDFDIPRDNRFKVWPLDAARANCGATTEPTEPQHLSREQVDKLAREFYAREYPEAYLQSGLRDLLVDFALSLEDVTPSGDGQSQKP